MIMINKNTEKDTKILFTMFLGLLKCFKNISACDYDM